MSKIEVLTPAQAGAALEEIASRTALLSGALAEIGTKLQTAEADLGEAVLAGNEDAVRGVADLRLRVDGLTAGLAALEKRRATAELDMRRAAAADLRRQAAVKQNDLDSLTRKSAKLLEQLSVLEGVIFTAGILRVQQKGAWYRPGLLPVEAHHGAYVDTFPDPSNNTPFSTPRSSALRSEIADLEGKAAAIEQELATPEPAPTALSPEHGKDFSDSSFRNPGPRGEWGQ
jgi:hypothetical protein